MSRTTLSCVVGQKLFQLRDLPTAFDQEETRQKHFPRSQDKAYYVSVNLIGQFHSRYRNSVCRLLINSGFSEKNRWKRGMLPQNNQPNNIQGDLHVDHGMVQSTTEPWFWYLSILTTKHSQTGIDNFIVL